jgi:hypothetical protein
VLIYRTQCHVVQTRQQLQAVARQAARLARICRPARGAFVSLLVDAGEVAAGVCDTLQGSSDDRHPVQSQLELGVLAVARALVDASYEGASVHLSHVERCFDDVCRHVANPTFARPVSEGFAYYAVSPESYLFAARALVQRVRRRCICVGVRSIGLTLGAIVAAAMESAGTSCAFCTVRPQGHPFARRLTVGSALETAWREEISGDATFAIVDEGPGMSGTTLTSVAEALSALGASDEQVVFVPSWDPDTSRFVSDDARRRWSRHARFVADFDATLAAESDPPWQGDVVADLGGGQWRQLSRNGHRNPVVHPQHERRKYLVRRDEEPQSDTLRWVKFAGYGRYGRAVLERANQAAESGWSPRPVAEGEGWISYPVLRGPMLRESDVTTNVLDRAAQYLAWVARTFRAAHAEIDALATMARHNVTTILGPAAADSFGAIARPLDHTEAVLLDGHMQLHEWIGDGDTWLKCDGAEHGDDHFYPGPADIAWDVAATCDEWCLDRNGREYLIGRYARLSGDAGVVHRLRFYEPSYLAFRAGYCTVASAQLEGSLDGARFGALRDRYAARLQQVLA